MSKDLNKVMLIGRLTQDPDFRTTPGGQNVASFTVATNRQWKDAQGQQQGQVEYNNVVAWRKLGEIANQYLRKGSQVFIEGYLQTRNWIGQQDNVKRYRTEVVADNMILLARPGGAGAQPAQQSSPAQQETPAAPVEAEAAPHEPVANASAPAEEEIRIEDIPF